MKIKQPLNIVILCLLICGVNVAYAQKTMTLNSDLAASAEMMKAKPKTRIGLLICHEIGEYELTSSKDGKSNKTESKDTIYVDGKPYIQVYTVNGRSYVHKNKYGTSFDIQLVAKKHQNINLEFAGPGNRIATAGYTFNQRYRASENVKGDDNASVTTSRITWVERSIESNIKGIGDNEWLLSAFQVYEKSQGTSFTAYLASGADTIVVNAINTWNNGKRVTAAPYTGFEFIRDGIAIGAVQVNHVMMKKLAWIRNDLDEDTKMLLAVAELTLLGAYSVDEF